MIHENSALIQEGKHLAAVVLVGFVVFFAGFWLVGEEKWHKPVRALLQTCQYFVYFLYNEMGQIRKRPLKTNCKKGTCVLQSPVLSSVWFPSEEIGMM